MEITADFEAERPGAVLALRDLYRIPPACELLVIPGKYVTFWGPGLKAHQARRFDLEDIRDAVRGYFGPYHVPQCSTDWDAVHK